MFGGHVGMRQAERREGNIGDMCAAASNKPSIEEEQDVTVLPTTTKRSAGLLAT